MRMIKHQVIEQKFRAFTTGHGGTRTPDYPALNSVQENSTGERSEGLTAE